MCLLFCDSFEHLLFLWISPFKRCFGPAFGLLFDKWRPFRSLERVFLNGKLNILVISLFASDLWVWVNLAEVGLMTLRPTICINVHLVVRFQKSHVWSWRLWGANIPGVWLASLCEAVWILNLLKGLWVLDTFPFINELHDVRQVRLRRWRVELLTVPEID